MTKLNGNDIRLYIGATTSAGPRWKGNWSLKSLRGL